MKAIIVGITICSQFYEPRFSLLLNLHLEHVFCRSDENSYKPENAVAPAITQS